MTSRASESSTSNSRTRTKESNFNPTLDASRASFTLSERRDSRKGELAFKYGIESLVTQTEEFIAIATSPFTELLKKQGSDQTLLAQESKSASMVTAEMLFEQYKKSVQARVLVHSRKSYETSPQRVSTHQLSYAAVSPTSSPEHVMASSMP